MVCPFSVFRILRDELRIVKFPVMKTFSSLRYKHSSIIERSRRRSTDTFNHITHKGKGDGENHKGNRV